MDAVRAAKVVDGVVVSVHMVYPDNVTEGFQITNQKVGIGYTYDGENFIPPPPNPKPDVTVITKLQFVEWCEDNDLIVNLLNLLDSDSMLKFKWDAATALEVDNPLVLGAAAVLGIDAQETFNDIG